MINAAARPGEMRSGFDHWPARHIWDHGIFFVHALKREKHRENLDEHVLFQDNASDFSSIVFTHNNLAVIV